MIKKSNQIMLGSDLSAKQLIYVTSVKMDIGGKWENYFKEWIQWHYSVCTESWSAANVYHTISSHSNHLLSS